eukprot:COSAG01_NODE_14672_length_1423_cov_1.567976_1_plen_59_part_10
MSPKEDKLRAVAWRRTDYACGARSIRLGEPAHGQRLPVVRLADVNAVVSELFEAGFKAF